MAPMTNDTAMTGDWVSPARLATARRMATTTTKPASTLYSRARKAMAPS